MSGCIITVEVISSGHIITSYSLCCLGAFGVVHKGEMMTSDGNVKTVAIKTIKCEYNYKYVCHTCDYTYMVCCATDVISNRK